MTDSLSSKRILLLSSNYGDGHQQAAAALREAIRLGNPDHKPIMLDFMRWFHPYVYPISRYVFLRGVQKFPSVYGYLFQKTRGVHSSAILKTFNLLSIRRMVRMIEAVRPSVIVSTFPLAAAAVSLLKEQGLIDLPTVTVITDHTDHSYWIHPFTDQYIVGSEPVRRALIRSGVEPSNISVTGIPIRPEFSRLQPKKTIREKLGLDPNLPTVLMMGGGVGILGEGLIDLASFNHLPHNIQLIIVCGHNQKLLHRLEEQLPASRHRVILTGYIDYVHELMNASDLLITKAGGLTTSEAVAQQLPMLFYKSLPGQERDNAKFFLKAGVATEAADDRDLLEKLAHILSNPQMLWKMEQNALRFNTKRSAFDAADIILQVARRPQTPYYSNQEWIAQL
ncbi:MGDG synthase family glycosyltransferase [Effusibacillus dendaii]|uniref:1,2-diacylglycerol 3-glucosyltransferase n=1 Tax=Effusibacillus dendaii TaxID=2743772 RepID=A0A7I8DES1_9BACL|nr:glycosyltransferase [Effusibacillus dendaii]BCJ87782.1 hypothetical protein skT53_27670 [Effusibacillus dendaii]